MKELNNKAEEKLNSIIDNKPLDEKELEKANGGDNGCIYDYTCYTAYRHPDKTRPGDACFMASKCILLMRH